MDFEFEVKKQTVDAQIITQLLNDNIPVIICGNGEIANLVKDRLMSNGIKNLYFCSLYGDENTLSEFEIDNIFSEYNVIGGYTRAYTNRNIFPNLKNKRNVYYLCELYGYADITDRITSNDYAKYKKDYTRVYETLADHKSKESYIRFLQAKINEDANMLNDVVEIPQYFSGDFLKFSANEALIDCGAYIGDSIKDFIKVTKGQYKSIIAFEPDPENIIKLEHFVYDNELHDVEIVKRAAYDEIKELRFSNSGIISSESEEGKTIIQTDTIDHIVTGRNVTYIKMDIEGSEIKALKGAYETIVKMHPVLGISVYHKSTDSFVIMDYIQKVWGGGTSFSSDVTSLYLSILFCMLFLTNTNNANNLRNRIRIPKRKKGKI